MSAPLFDFSHLTPAERIELAEQLWDSLPEEAVGVSPEQLEALRPRRADLSDDPGSGRPWREVLDEIRQRGA